MNNWITTTELITYLKAHPYKETVCRLYLGYNLGSTHYWYWDSKFQTFMHTCDWPYYSVSEKYVIEDYGQSRWLIEDALFYQIAPLSEKSSERGSASRFYCYLCHVIKRFRCLWFSRH